MRDDWVARITEQHPVLSVFPNHWVRFLVERCRRMEEAVRQFHTPALFHDHPLSRAALLTIYSSRFAHKPHPLAHPCFGVRLTAGRKSKVR
jgi:hypothetical protein